MQHKSAQHAPGTVLSIKRIPGEVDSDGPSKQKRVCFSSDSFAEVSNEDRSEYEPVERARQAADGPRCLDLNTDSSAVPLKPGDHLDVYFMLENEGKIDLVRVSAHGRDL